MDDYKTIIEERGTCPRCSSPVEWDLDCPGWGNPVMVCRGCGNAERWDCTNDACGWWYAEPWKRIEPTPMGERPDWLKEAA